MTETPSIYKPHKPTRKIGDLVPPCDTTVSGDSIVRIPHSCVCKAVAVVLDARTNTEETMNIYFGDRLNPNNWEMDARDAIEYAITPLGFKLMEVKYLAEVTVDFNMKSLFEAVPEEERIVYKDELTTE